MKATETVSATRKIEFCAGHRVFGHENKCAHPHGHNYEAHFTAVAPLDSLGRVIDFSVLKERIGGWIENRWDHAFIFYENDAPMRNSLFQLGGQQGKAPKVFSLPSNPTAENMAKYLLDIVCPTVLEGTGVGVTHVRLWETANCYADAHVPRQSEVGRIEAEFKRLGNVARIARREPLVWPLP